MLDVDSAGLSALTAAVRALTGGAERCRREFADRAGMGISEVVALATLYADGPRTPSEIGARLGLTAGSVTALIDRLERGEHAVRSPHPADRRSLLVKITESGSELIAELYAVVEQRIAETLRALNGPPATGGTAPAWWLADVVAALGASLSADEPSAGGAGSVPNVAACPQP